MIFITIEEIANYVKIEIIRDYFTNVNSTQCVLDVLLNNGEINKNISKVAKYFLDEKKRQLYKTYKSIPRLFFRKYEYENILNEYLCAKYNVEKCNLEKFLFDSPEPKIYKKITLEFVSKLHWKKLIDGNTSIYESVDKDGKKIEIIYNKSNGKKKKRKSSVKYDGVKKTNLDYSISELVTCIEKTMPVVKSAENRAVIVMNNSQKKKDKKTSTYMTSSHIYMDSLELNMIARKYKVSIDSLVGYVCDIQKKCKYCQRNYCSRLHRTCYPYYKDCIMYDKFMNKLLLVSQSRNKSSRPQAVVSKKSENKQERGKSIANTQSKKKLHQIGVKDFVVRSNVFHCIHQSHQIQNVDAVIRVCMNNGDDKQIQISAGYCEQCKVYFIMESTYQELKRKGIILCRVTDSKTYMKGGFMNGSKLAQESILMQYGYNVSRTGGLTERQRQKILAVMIDNKVLSKGGIISYLDFFIHQHSSRNNMGVAISKWEADREFVEHYRTGEYTKFGVNAIYRR